MGVSVSHKEKTLLHHSYKKAYLHMLDYFPAMQIRFSFYFFVSYFIRKEEKSDKGQVYMV